VPLSLCLLRSTAAVLALLSFVLAGAKAADHKTAPVRRGSDDRFKADLLLVIAHPDDETGDIGGYLARAIFDQHRRVAVVCTTRGDGGGDSVSNNRGAALGAKREIEARQAFTYLGISDVWFVGAPDTGGGVLSSLERWNHGLVLGEVVRIMRLTRPEVVLTWLPDYVAGENHGDHQASSVIATEAFDLAGDPTAFPEQITAEGLGSWQPQKIYYFSDAFDAGGYWINHAPKPSPFRKNFLEGTGPTYLPTEISPSRHVSYARLCAEETAFYLTQSGGSIAKKALERDDLKLFEFPVHIIFGKSLVGGSTTGDVFEAVKAEAIPFPGRQAFQLVDTEKALLSFGGSWQFYRNFWQVHNIEHLAQLLPTPEVAVESGEQLHVPLILCNRAEEAETLHLQSVLPDGWIDHTSYDRYPVEPRTCYPIFAVIDVLATEPSGWKELTWKLDANGQELGTIMLRVEVVADN